MTTYAMATLAINAAHAVASLGAVAAILVGIRQMRRAGDLREKREDARHREAMRDADQRHAEAMRSLEAIIKGMETVIERTGTRAERPVPERKGLT